jgi:parallel beta-helix repeat protein
MGSNKINSGKYKRNKSSIAVAIMLMISSIVIFSPNVLADVPEFINVKLSQSTDLINWSDIDGTLRTGFTLELDPTVTYHYLDVKYADTNTPLQEGFYGFNITNNPDGFFEYWETKGVNSSATPGSWMEFAWGIINGISPTFYIHVDADHNLELIDGLFRDYFGVPTQKLQVNGDYPTGRYTYRGNIKASDGNFSNPINFRMEFEEEISFMDEPEFLDLELKKSVDLVNWSSVFGSLYSGYSVPINSSYNNYSFSVFEASANKDLTNDYFGFYLSSTPAGHLAYWASKGVDGTALSGTWEHHMWKIINGNAPSFYLYVEIDDTFHIIDGLSKDFYGIDDALFSINGDSPLGSYSYIGSLTTFSGIDSDPITVFINLLDPNSYSVWIDDNYDPSTPGWGVDHFASIQDGINASAIGGLVYVKPGTYDEVISVNKPVIIKSTMGSDVTKITDSSASYSELLANGGQTVQLASSNLLIDDLTIERISSVVYVAALGNNGYPGLSNIEINNCEFEALLNCTYLADASSIFLSGSTFSAQSDDTMIILDNLSSFIVKDVEMSDYNLIGIILTNSIDGLFNNMTLSQKSYKGMIVEQCTDIRFEYSLFSYNYDQGLIIGNSSDIEVYDTLFRNNDFALCLSDNAKVYLNEISYSINNRNLNRACRINSDTLHYSQIQEAINDSSALDSINIYPGNYYDNIIINKSISLNGLIDVEDTILTGENSSPTILIASDVDAEGVQIDSLSITGGNNCIQTGKNQDVSGLIIANCIIINPDFGYALYIDPHNYSDIPPIRDGTDVFGTPVFLLDNTVIGGVYYQFWPYEIYGVSVNTQLYVEGNNIDNMFLNGSISVDLIDNEFGSLGMMYSSDVLIERNRFENPLQERYGIYLWSINGTGKVKDVTIQQNTIIGYSSFAVSQGVSGQGIIVAGAMDVIISGNEIIANSEGIWITEDYINRNGERCVGDIYDVIIENNDIENSQTGIKLLTNVNETEISGNHFNINGQGIWVLGSNGHIISENSFIGNYYGLRFNPDCENNLIYNNYFADNFIHAYDHYSETNQWNVTIIAEENIMGGPYIGGNYWDDYAGVDINGDGLGDTDLPYNSSGEIYFGGDMLPIVFSDNEAPEVTVIYPNGGESINQTITILWDAVDNIDDDLSIDIEYSDDSGETWYMIAPNVENNGNYDWNTSDLDEGSNYLIKITATDISGNSANDTSDSTFSIYLNIPGPEVEITNPLIGYLYFFNDRKIRFLNNNCFAFGHLNIQAQVNTLLDVDHVEFYIDNQIVHTEYNISGNIFSWEWDESVLFYHDIKVIAYDTYGAYGEDIIGVTIFNFDIIP